MSQLRIVNKLWSLPRSEKIVVSADIELDFPAKGSIAVDVDGLLLDRRPAWPRAPGLWWCKHRDRRGADPEDEQMASKQTNKQATSAAKTNNSARKPERQTQRRISPGRSKSAATTRTSPAAGHAAMAPEGGSEGIDLSTNTTPLPEHQAAQSTPSSEGADLAPANVPGADRPRASTKRALLIGMLERPEGASVAELGQRLGWLPHTVRAAMTGLRHAGREVTRSKDAEGQSVYRLARPETVGR
jgi:hypothetical protein